MILHRVARWSFVACLLTFGNSLTEANNKGRMNYGGSASQNQNQNENPAEIFIKKFLFPGIAPFPFFEPKLSQENSAFKPFKSSPIFEIASSDSEVPLMAPVSSRPTRPQQKQMLSMTDISWPKVREANVDGKQFPILDEPHNEQNQNQDNTINVIPEERDEDVKAKSNIKSGEQPLSLVYEKQPFKPAQKASDSDVTIDFEVEIVKPGQAPPSKPMTQQGIDSPVTASTTTTTTTPASTKPRALPNVKDIDVLRPLASFFDIIFPTHRHLIQRELGNSILGSKAQGDLDVPQSKPSEKSKTNPKPAKPTESFVQEEAAGEHCGGVRCSPPPAESNCVLQKSKLNIKSPIGLREDWSPFSQVSDCCPLYLCNREEDGSFHIHYGLMGSPKRHDQIFEQIVEKEAQKQAETEEKTPREVSRALKQLDLQRPPIAFSNIADLIARLLKRSQRTFVSNDHSMFSPRSSPPMIISSASHNNVQVDLEDDRINNDLFPVNFRSKALLRNPNIHHISHLQAPRVIAIGISSSRARPFSFPASFMGFTPVNRRPFIF